MKYITITMAGAKRNDIHSQIWHITHRCHIDYQRLTELFGFDSCDEVKIYHKSWVDNTLGNGKNARDENMDNEHCR